MTDSLTVNQALLKLKNMKIKCDFNHTVINASLKAEKGMPDSVHIDQE